MKKKRSVLLPAALAALAAVLLCSQVCRGAAVPDTGDPNERACNRHSYTDLGNGIIRDNVTGLMWQQATAPGTYTWQQALTYCDNLTLGGYSDWRLPPIRELASLVDSGIAAPGPAISTTYFTDTAADYYWSSTPLADIAGGAWDVNFSYGDIHHGYDNTSTYYVRAVRGDMFTNTFIDNGDGTVTDNSTGLMWQQQIGATTYTWEDAQDYCASLSLASYADWRLPTRNEIQSMVDYSENNPASNPVFFPGEVAANHWTSTTNAATTTNAWGLNFYNGNAFYDYQKTGSYYVRAVRGGTCDVACVDQDGDGYGTGCAAGPDCDDADPAVHDGCPTCVLTVVPKTIFRIMSFVRPVRGFVLIGDKNTAFTRDDKPAWESEAITPLVRVRLGRRVMVALVFVHPLALQPGDSAVTAGSCSGTLTVR